MLEGLLEAIQFQSLFYLFLGTLLAIFLGALPGIGPTLSIALMVPFTFFMTPTTAMIFLAAIYNGAIYGGSITAVLINVPGTPGSAATCMDGFAMAQKGEAGKALGISLSSSAFGGFVSALALLFAAPAIAKFSLLFGPAQYFWLAVWGLTVIAAVTTGSFLRGLIASVIGFFLSMVGIDSITGTLRFNFGVLHLYDGFDMLALVVGVFAASQVLSMANEGGTISRIGRISGRVTDGLLVPFRYMFTLLRSTGIGILFGAIPGVGMTAASFFAYSEAVRTSKNPGLFGEGNPEGIIGPEAANNATVGGALIPALTLGIPGSESTVVLLGAIFLHGLRPGLNIIVENSQVFYGLVMGLILANIMILIIGTLGANFFARVTIIPTTVLVPVITAIYFIGAYASGNSVFNILVALSAGVLAFIMKRYKYSLVSLLLAFVLGPIVESNFTRALMISGGSYRVAFFGSWLSWILAVITFGSLIWALYREFNPQNRSKDDSGLLSN